MICGLWLIAIGVPGANRVYIRMPEAIREQRPAIIFMEPLKIKAMVIISQTKGIITQ